MTSQAKVLFERRGHVFWMTLNRPEKRNAIDHEMIERLHDGLRQAHENPEIRAIVLTGAGDKAFCAGADLNPGKGFVFDYSQPTSAYPELLRYAVRSTLPIVARVNGACMAGGMGLFCLADMAVAADHAIFGLPEVKVGVFPMQVLTLLRHFVAPRVLNEWCLTGEPFSAAVAREAGLLNYVVPASDLDTRVDWLVDRLIDKSPTAIRRGKYAMHAIHDMSFEQSLVYTENQIATLALTEDAAEGMAAFNDKRPPNWTGR